ncbi:uncharacterized protein LOC119737641 isoform X9 [Patiria miniata]|uniref:Uncharacterized protein n=1 Tax=Patiria miniata TaxID=46514 RepID=A0A914AXQ7_PATMI|nr:uncharacterized protein LOC119737641 isoform X9 [Patiria miniata]
MWHAPSKSAPSHHRHPPSNAASQKGKTPTRSKVEVWEPLRGWQDDLSAEQDIETIDIDLWSKKNNKRKKDAAKVTPDGMEVYLCWTSNHCPEIPDFEEFVSDSLSANLKPVESAPPKAPSPPVKQTKAKLKASVPSKTKSPVKNEGVHSGAKHKASEPKSSGDDSGRYDAKSEASGSSMVGRPISTAYTASECPERLDGESPPGSGSDGQLSGGDGAPARPVGGTRSAPASRVQDRTEQKSRKIASAKLRGDSTKRSPHMRRVAIRNSAAKSSLDTKRLTFDMPPSPPNYARLSNPSSPPQDEANNTNSRPEADKSSVLRLVEERLKRTSVSGRLNFDLPNSGSMSVGDLLSSSPRIVHRLGPAGDTERDPNVYKALTGNITVGDHKDTISPWFQGDSAIESHRGLTGTIPNGARTKETSRSILPSVSSGNSVVSAAPTLDSTSTGDSVMMRQGSPVVSGDGQSTTSAAATDDAKILKKPLQCAISRCDRDAAELPMANIPQTEKRSKGRVDSGEQRPTRTSKHRGSPGFRPAGKTPLQRAVESAHKKMHGQHYYLFAHSSNSQSTDVKNLPRYSSKGQPVRGHRERASSGRSNQSERSINNAYVWKEHLESQIKQQRTTTAPSGSNTGGISHQQTNPRTNQSSSATSVPLTLMPSQTRNRKKLSYTFSWENGQVRHPTSSQCSTGMATP